MSESQPPSAASPVPLPAEGTVDEQMFPKLTAEQLERLTKHGHEQTFEKGDVLFDQGDAEVAMYVVLSGAVEVVRSGVNGEDHVAEHHAGQFTGDVDMLSLRKAIVRARALEPTRAFVVDHDCLRSLVQTDAELGEIILRAYILRRRATAQSGKGDVTVVGSTHSSATLRLIDFLDRNRRPYEFMDVDRDSAAVAVLETWHIGVDDIPLVILRGNQPMRAPSIEDLAEMLGLNPLDRSSRVVDVVVVGAGPSGLSAAVYASSEGLKVLVLESFAAGGQAGASARIENYLGFPTGISGRDLAALAFVQAEKFGTEVTVTRKACSLACNRSPYRIEIDGGGSVDARAVIIASGAEYRRLEIPDLARFEGNGVHYALSVLDARMCKDEEVVVVGGGNSAGQAAVSLASLAKHVHVVVRGHGLGDSMSWYLNRRLEENPRVTIHRRTQVVSLEGKDCLERVEFASLETNTRKTFPVRYLFSMLGALPNTSWLGGCVVLDEKGFVKTGPDLTAEELTQAGWSLERRPYLFETSLPAVFAVGDVRSGSLKRVAAAVGEGSGCVQLLHRALAEHPVET
jgi:thioredoxin reductase (NADPH)